MKINATGIIEENEEKSSLREDNNFFNDEEMDNIDELLYEKPISEINSSNSS